MGSYTHIKNQDVNVRYNKCYVNVRYTQMICHCFQALSTETAGRIMTRTEVCKGAKKKKKQWKELPMVKTGTV